MEKLKDLTHKSLTIQTLDYEEYQKNIGQIFQRVKRATTSFQVHTVILSKLMYLLIVRSQLEMANSIQETANMIHDDIKASISVSWLVTNTD